MKKVYNILMSLLVSAVALSSCSEDTNAPDIKTLAVQSAGTTIAAEGGQDTIRTAATSVTATAADNWLSVSTQGGSVIVKADVNESLESRHTTVTLSDNDGNKAIINVTQLGLVLYVKGAPENAVFNDDARSLSYDAVTTTDAQVVSTPSWMEAKFSDGMLKINIAANNDGHIRTGYVVYANNVKRDSIPFTQGEFKDIEGFYILSGYAADGTEEAYLAQITTGKNMPAVMNVAYNDTTILCIPILFNEDNLMATMYNVQNAGTFILDNDKADADTTCVISNAFISSTGSLSYDASISMNIPFRYYKAYGTIAQFSDNGSCANNTLYGMAFQLFTAMPATQSTYIKNADLGMILQPMLIEYTPSAAKKHHLTTLKPSL